MRIFGLEEAQVVELAAGVRPQGRRPERGVGMAAGSSGGGVEPPDTATAAQIFARAAWSGLAEPGDGLAGCGE